MSKVSPAESLKAELAALDVEPFAPSGGVARARRRSDVVDAALRRLFAPFAHPSGGPGAGRVALVALGGYGRGELTPGSDIDLMILHDDEDRDLAERAAAAVLYPLWDLGAGTGHATRTPDECRSESLREVRTLTALLDARLLGGSRTLLAATLEWVTVLVRSAPGVFVKQLYQSREERRERFGFVSHSQAPDLKEALGGMRDVQLFGWLARGLLEEDITDLVGPSVERDPSGLGRLAEEGLLRTSEARSVEAAQDLLLAARAALHIRTRGRSNVQAADEQAGVAATLGVADEEGWEARDALVRDLLRLGRRVDLAAEACLDRAAASAEGRPLAAVPLMLDRPFPETAVETLATAAEQGLAVEAAELDNFEQEAPAVAGMAWSQETRDAFVRILAAGEAGSRALELADALGLLEALVPEWASVAGRPQRDPYHQFPVDVHLLRAAATAARLIAAPGEGFDAEAARSAGDSRPLLLGALLHDIGKIGRGSHVEAGEEIAAGILRRMGVGEADREDVAFLVREHLLLANSATRRNIDDPDLVLRVGSHVGSDRRLAMLYLLTAADAEATGPNASSPWRMGLARDLVARISRALQRGLVDAGSAERLVAAEEAIRNALSAFDETESAAFVQEAPAAYMLAVAPEDVAAHVPLLVPPPSPEEVRTSVQADRLRDTYRVGVGARDRPGLLAMMAGAFTLSGLTILSARAFTTAGGVALDMFEVRGAYESDVDDERWERFRETLRDALAGRIDLAERVAALRAYYLPSPTDIPVTVRIDEEASDFYTVVEVGAADRLGLLFDLASAFFERELDLHLAKVATYGPRVVDVFYVTDLEGRKLAALAADLEDALRARLA